MQSWRRRHYQYLRRLAGGRDDPRWCCGQWLLHSVADDAVADIGVVAAACLLSDLSSVHRCSEAVAAADAEFLLRLPPSPSDDTCVSHPCDGAFSPSVSKNSVFKYVRQIDKVFKQL